LVVKLVRAVPKNLFERALTSNEYDIKVDNKHVTQGIKKTSRRIENENLGKICFKVKFLAMAMLLNFSIVPIACGGENVGNAKLPVEQCVIKGTVKDATMPSLSDEKIIVAAHKFIHARKTEVVYCSLFLDFNSISLEGRVIDENGDPIPGIPLTANQVLKEDWDSREYTPDLWVTKSGANGRFFYQ
jgi:hypothetical protein